MTSPGLATENKTHSGPAVSVANAVVEFHRKSREPFRALDNISLTVGRGQVTCLLGPNGSGKTTLLNVLTGLLTVNSGDVDVLGLEPAKHRKEILRNLAVVPQETAIYPELSARENLKFHAAYYGLVKTEIDARVTEALELVELTSRADDRAGTFSGGMQRRLALARAMMMRPSLLLLDEPTLGVDVQSREAIWLRIEDIATSGQSVLLTTNYMEEAERLGDRIVIIDRGRNVTEGTLSELVDAVPAPALRVELATVDAAREAAEKLGPELRPGIAGRSLVLDGKDSRSHLHDVKALLDAIPPSRIVHLDLPTASLQDVFLHFTGRELRD